MADNDRCLLIDVGAGTMDILYYEGPSKTPYKAAVESPVHSTSKEAAGLPGNLLLTGCEMGGGALSEVLRERARTSSVVMTPSAAMTVSHDPEQVLSKGIRIVSEDTARELALTGGYGALCLTDLPMERIERIVTGFGVSFEFDVVGICAQDHGTPPPGVSHLDYRHNIFKDVLDGAPYPHSLLYKGDEVPKTFNRLRSIAESAKSFGGAREIYVMDSGFAAILGASMDAEAGNRTRIMVLDIATSHTVGATLIGEEIAALFEYHTRDITLEKLEMLLRDLADGKLEHERILKGGGHGAYTRKAVGFENIEAIIATGPKRGLLASSKLPIRFGAPLGDNMMTGAVGLLEAIRRRKGLPQRIYL